jgi:hypothetical protein
MPRGETQLALQGRQHNHVIFLHEKLWCMHQCHALFAIIIMSAGVTSKLPSALVLPSARMS